MLNSDLFSSLPEHRQLWLALSGGLDSVVLLDLAVAYCDRQGVSLNVVHVHHGLSPSADDWLEHCHRLCRGYQELRGVTIRFYSEKVRLNAASDIEAQARQARYRVFEDCLQRGDLLLMAHHADDQLETLLLRLMRGAGSQGLSGMPPSRSLGAGMLYRPLLQYERAELEAYAREQGLSWVEDESNQRDDFDRNYLRHHVVPRLKQRWPQGVPVAARSARMLSESQQLNEVLARQDLQQVAVSDQVLDSTELLALTPERQRNLLRFWLKQAGLNPPEAQHLETILQQVVQARADAQPCFQRPDYTLRRYRGQLFLQMPEQAAAEISAVAEQQRISLPLKAETHLALNGVVFQLMPQPELSGTGILLPAESVLMLRERQGGEALRLPGRGRKTLKKLLQERGVPAWLRDQVRLFWLSVAGDEPLLVGAWAPEAHVSEGIFWWDSVLQTESGKSCQHIEIKPCLR